MEGGNDRRVDEKSDRNHMTWRAPGGARRPGLQLLRRGTGRRDSHGCGPGPTVSGSGFSLARAGRVSTGVQEVPVGGGRFLVAGPWLPEPEPRVDGRGGRRTHRAPPRGPGVLLPHGRRGAPGRPLSQYRRPADRRGPGPQRAGSPGPPHRPAPRAEQVSPMEIQIASVGQARWPPCADSPSSSPVCPRVWGARGQHRGHGAAPRN